MSKPKPPDTPVDKSRRLDVPCKPGQTEDRAVTDLMAQGVASNASLVLRYMQAEQGSLSLSDMVASLNENGAAVNRGDMASAEKMLTAQAAALNAIFSELARRAALNMGDYLDATDRYMRLALKAQSQCRATVETLAEMKNPPVLFARQANINNGGQQQVNNGPDRNSPRMGTHPAETVFRPNELLEDRTHGNPTMDTRATAAPSRTNQGLEPVGAVNRPANR